MSNLACEAEVMYSGQSSPGRPKWIKLAQCFCINAVSDSMSSELPNRSNKDAREALISPKTLESSIECMAPSPNAFKAFDAYVNRYIHVEFFRTCDCATRTEGAQKSASASNSASLSDPCHRHRRRLLSARSLRRKKPGTG